MTSKITRQSLEAIMDEVLYDLIMLNKVREATEVETDEEYLKAKKALLSAVDRYTEERELLAELRGRSDELVKLTEWGKTIDDQWNNHFKTRLKELNNADNN